MARLNINPNRMELTRLKRRVVVAKRGHKLLKDKQDALIKAFLDRAREAKDLRESLEEELMECYKSFLLARAQTLPVMLEQALMISGSRVNLDVTTQNVMSVVVPVYDVRQEGSTLNYGLATSLGSLDVALERFSEIISKLIDLASKEKAIKLMAKEIEKTRRRVNALEHVMIPAFVETIKYITMKLDEQERSNTSRLMKIKEIVRSH
ncbi:MAG: V-type ATP synthase subunit D [Synergistales bacterium]|nr:V-type ATP synthase subunit D [Synergistales bacterium]